MLQGYPNLAQDASFDYYNFAFISKNSLTEDQFIDYNINIDEYFNTIVSNKQ